MWTRRQAGLAATGLAAWAGCTPLPDVSYVTDHAEIGTFFDAPLCAGNLVGVDATIERLGGAFDVLVVDKVRLYWGRDGVKLHCPLVDADYEGCFGLDTNVAFVQSGAVDHELAHAVGSLAGTMDPFFEEGMAHALTEHSLLNEDFDARPSELLGLSQEEFVSTPGSRRIAKHFVRFLIEEQGMAPLNELRRLSLRGASQAETLAAFERVHGAPMAAYETAWAVRAPLSFGSDYQPFGGRPVDEWRGDELEIRRTLACDDADTRGPLAGFAPPEFYEHAGMYTYATFDVLSPGRYEIGLTGAGGRADAKALDCWATSPDGTNAFVLEAETSEEVELWACRWLVIFWVEGTDDVDLGLTLRRVGDAP
jgi:hypothetical protein